MLSILFILYLRGIEGDNMYNLDKIKQELEKIDTPLVEPKIGDLYVGRYIGNVTPAGMSITYIDLDNGSTHVYIPNVITLQYAMKKAGISIGDHVALMVRGIHHFGKWGQKLPRWVAKKLVKVGDMYE